MSGSCPTEVVASEVVGVWQKLPGDNFPGGGGAVLNAIMLSDSLYPKTKAEATHLVAAARDP